VNDAPTELACEGCGRVLTKVRIAPSIVRSGWRCGRPACAPRREAAPVHHAGADLINLTSTVSSTAKKGGRRVHDTA
jgi:hypothetical protein